MVRTKRILCFLHQINSWYPSFLIFVVNKITHSFCPKRYSLHFNLLFYRVRDASFYIFNLNSVFFFSQLIFTYFYRITYSNNLKFKRIEFLPFPDDFCFNLNRYFLRFKNINLIYKDFFRVYVSFFFLNRYLRQSF